jgi:hypothetical protein
MNTIKYIGCLSAVLLGLSARSVSADTIDDQLAQSNSIMSAGDFFGATLILGPNYPGRVVRSLRNNKIYKPGLLQEAAAPTPVDIATFEKGAKALEAANIYKIITPTEADQSFAALRAAYVRETIAGHLKATIFDDLDLRAPDTDQQQFNLDLVRNTLTSDRQLGLEDAIQLRSFILRRAGAVEMRDLIAKTLPEAKASMAALRGPLHDLAPAAADALLAARQISIHVATDGDGLLMLDLKDRLNQFAEIKLVDEDTATSVKFTVRQIGLSIQEMPPNSDTVSIPQADVSFGYALLLMPRNSKYTYTLTQGQVDYEYAFDLSGPSGSHAVLRDQKTSRWSVCSNFLVVNIFGGSQPVGWMANYNMAATCNGSIRETTRSVKAAIVQKLASAIVEQVAPGAEADNEGAPTIPEGTPGYVPPPLRRE